MKNGSDIENVLSVLELGAVARRKRQKSGNSWDSISIKGQGGVGSFILTNDTTNIDRRVRLAAFN